MEEKRKNLSLIFKRLLEIFQGFTIGIANVIPGFSGGTMAVIFGVYERIINALSTFFRHPIKTIKDIWAVAVGMVLGIVFALVAIVKLLEFAPIPTTLFFVGLIIGSIPFVFLLAKKEGKVKLIDLILFALGVAVLVVLPFLKGSEASNTNMSFWLVLIVFGLGIIAAATMIIPGVSGSLVLMVLGYYTFITGTIYSLLDAFIVNDFSTFTKDFIVTIIFGVGAVLGLVYISKPIKILLKKCPRSVYWTILGLLVASPFSIIMAVFNEYPKECSKATIGEYVIGIILLIIGAISAGYFSLYENKHMRDDNINED